MNRRQALSRKEVEAVLTGGPHDHDALRGLLEAARRPAEPRELTGLAAATAELRSAAAPTALVPRTRARATRTRLAGRLAASAVGAKLALACLGAAALGGIAYSAAGGKLPGTAHHPPASASSLATVSSTHSRDSATPTPGSSPHTVAPAAALRGLCVSWFASANDPNRATGSRFATLVNAAGGAGDVTSYCTTLVSTTANGNLPHPSGIGHPSRPSTPGSSGGSPRPAHPTKPAHPSKAPTKPSN